MKIIIDRIEGDFAVAELPDGTFENMAKSLLPEGAREGSVIDISIDQGETSQRKEKMQSRLDSLFKD